MRRFFWIAAIALGAPIVFAQEQDVTADIEETVTRYFQELNARGGSPPWQILDYPSLWLYPGYLFVSDNPPEDTGRKSGDSKRAVPPKILRSVTVVDMSTEKANVRVGYEVPSDVPTLIQNDAAFVLTRRNRDWRVRFKAMPVGSRSGEARVEARQLLNVFFDAWNAADNAAIHKTLNFPHAFIFADGGVRVADGPSDIVTDFDKMRSDSGWHQSSLDSAKTIFACEDLVWFRIVFSRRHADGTAYLTVPADWFVSKQNGHWGIQIRSMMPPVETAE